MIKKGLTQKDEEVLKAIPEKHLEDLESIIRTDRELNSETTFSNMIWLPKPEGGFIEGVKKLYAGLYFPKSRSILLSNKYANEETLAHEVGHHVFWYHKNLINFIYYFLEIPELKKTFRENFADNYAEKIMRGIDYEREKRLGIDSCHV